MNTMNNTLLGLELFSDEIKDSIIIHIPHSSNFIPDYTAYLDLKLLEADIHQLTDWYTDEIFAVDGVTTVKAEFSRLFCDVERLDDAHEEMYQFGRGFYYTKSDSGNDLREESAHKESVYKNYYLTHHLQLEKAVTEKLEKHGFCLIIDGHSFADIPFASDLNKKTPRPDICLGTHPQHTPDWQVKMAERKFAAEGFSVRINDPYAGTIVPLKYNGNPKVHSIMIEVNRKLYMHEDRSKKPEVIRQLQTIIRSMIEI
jgi:N-formylglutamate amidohydrolase